MPVLLHPINRMNDIDRNFQSRQFNEVVFKYGFPAKYIKKSSFDPNIVLGESDRSSYDGEFEVVVLVRGIREFGSQSMGTKFGWESVDTSSIFIDELQMAEVGLSLSIGDSGDLIYFPELNNKIFEINFTTNESEMVKYHFGVGFSWQMDVQKYALNLTDKFNTAIPIIDNLNNGSVKVVRDNNDYQLKQDTDQIYNMTNPLMD